MVSVTVSGHKKRTVSVVQAKISAAGKDCISKIINYQFGKPAERTLRHKVAALFSLRCQTIIQDISTFGFDQLIQTNYPSYWAF